MNASKQNTIFQTVQNCFRIIHYNGTTLFHILTLQLFKVLKQCFGFRCNYMRSIHTDINNKYFSLMLGG